MNKRRLIVSVLALILFAGLFQLRSGAPTQKSYEGSPVIYWVKRYTRHPRRDMPFQASALGQDLERLLKIGTNAIPYLVRERDYESLMPENAMRVLSLGLRNYGQTDVRVNAEDGVKPSYETHQQMPEVWLERCHCRRQSN